MMYNDWGDRPLEFGDPPKSEQTPLGWRCPVCGKSVAPDVKECSCLKARRSGVLEDSLSWIYEDFTPPEA